MINVSNLNSVDSDCYSIGHMVSPLICKEYTPGALLESIIVKIGNEDFLSNQYYTSWIVHMHVCMQHA